MIDAGTGNVIYSNNPDIQTSPASLAKLMTLYLTFEALETGKLKLNQSLPISRRASQQPASKLYLQAGQTITVEESILANPLDGVVLLAGCDKTTAAMLMG